MEELLELKQVAKILGVSERTVFRLMDKKEIQGIKIMRKWKFRPSAVEEYIKSKETPTAPPPTTGSA